MTACLYYERANWVGRSEPLEITVVEAWDRHRNREPYGVRFVDADTRIEIDFLFGKTYCTVNFFDEDGRRDLMYAFEESGEDLFLFQATYSIYDDRTNIPSQTEIYSFDRSGRVRILVGRPRERKVARSEDTFDVRRNLEAHPDPSDFATIRRLAARER